jgi:hypothetical protein
MRLRTIQVSMLSLLVLGLYQTAEAQRGRGPGFGRGFGSSSLEDTAVRLASIEAVQKEIKAEEEQVKKLEVLATENREAAQGIFSGFQGLQDLSEEERDKKIAEAREKMAKASAENTKKAKEILNPEQLQRLKEIAFQQATQGSVAGAFRIDEFAKSAKITDEQKEKAEQLNEELRAEAEKTSDNRREQFTWLRQSSGHEGASIETSWSSEELPAGFRAVSTHEEAMYGSDELITHILFSDGLANISVFIAAKSGELTVGPARVGGSNSYSVESGGFEITAIGEVPAMTVEQIATTMRHP